MLGIWLITGAALGGVVLEDGGGCLSREDLELELRAWLGDDPVDNSELRVRLTASEPAWQLRIDASSLDGEALWWHEGQVQPADCPVLPGLIARIAEQQFAGAPRWGLAPPPPLRREVVGELAGTAPNGLHFVFGGGVGVPISQRARWVVHVDGYLGSEVSLGEDRNGSGEPRSGQFVGLLVGGGASYDLVTGPTVLRARGTVAVGPHLAYGRGFEKPLSGVRLRATANLQLDFVSTALLRIGGRVTVPFVRLAPASQPRDAIAAEPWVRAGFVIGLGGPVGAPIR